MMASNPMTDSETPWGYYVNPESDWTEAEGRPAGAAPNEGTSGASWASKVPWGDVAGAGLGMIGSLFGQGMMKDPYAEAESSLQQIPGEMEQQMSPYIQAGREAVPTLESQYSALLKDPTSLMKAIGSKYQASPGYQYNVDQATRAANQASAAGGMVGSPAEQAELAKTVTGLSSRDYGEFMNRALGLYGEGLQGWGGLERGGQQASQQMAENLARAQESQASLKAAQAQSENERTGGTLGAIAGGLGSLASLLF